MSPARASSTAEGQQLRRAAGFDDLAVHVERVDRLVDLDRARLDAAGQDAADEIVAVEQRREEGEGRLFVEAGRRNMRHDRLEQRLERAFARVGAFGGIAAAARGIKDREIKLFVIGVERQEQFEHFVEHFGGARVAAVDLVDDDDRLEAERQRLAGHELGLRHRAFGRIDEQDDAVDHRQDPLDLAAEVGVARRVDDVDARRIGAFAPLDRGALGENREPAFLFQVIGIHGSFFDTLVVAESARLAEKLVDEGRLAMVDVCDNRNIAQRHAVGTLMEGGSARSAAKRRAPNRSGAAAQQERRGRPI